MSLKERLKRLQINLESFDLESFFHDDTFINMLEDREFLEKHYDDISSDLKEKLYFIDEIIWGYYNLYKNEKLSGYAKLSFDVFEKVANISKKHILKEAA